MKGEKKSLLWPKRFGVTRQTVQNAIQTIDEGRIKVPNEEQAQAQPPLAKTAETKNIILNIMNILLNEQKSLPSIKNTTKAVD